MLLTYAQARRSTEQNSEHRSESIYEQTIS